MVLLLIVPAVIASTIGGTIRDESGGSVAGVRVALTEKSKRLSYTSETDQDGSFLFTPVLVGSYSLLAEKSGFRAHKVDDLAVEVGGSVALSITLAVGDVRTVVTVSAAEHPEIETSSSTLGGVVDTKRVQELPLNGREFLQLALLVGGAAEIASANNLYTSNIGPPMRQIVLPATLPHFTGYSINGLTVSGARDGELAAGLSVTAIDQFKIHEGFLMPDQGIGPGLVDVATKTGGNQFHGETFYFLRNRNLDARSFFAAAPEDLKRNQFGGSVGGPMWRDRIWFHGFYEGARDLTAFQTAGFSPTAAMFRGELAETGRTIHDPQTFNASSGQRLPFPDAAVPPNRINGVARALLDYYLPGSSLASRPSNTFGNPRNRTEDDQGGVRLDLISDQRHKFALQLLTQSASVDLPGLYPLSGNLYLNGLTMGMAEHTWSLSPRLVNHLRIGFIRAEAVGGNQAQTSLLSSIGVMNTYGDKGISVVNLQGYSPFGNATGDLGNRDNTWEIDEQFNYTHGRHLLAAGVGFRYRRGWHQNSNRSALGVISFQPTFTAQLARNAQGQLSPVAGTGDSFADFLLGMPLTGILSGLPVAEYRGSEVVPFVQDTWRISRDLTLNFGVSWFLETPPDPRNWAKRAVHGFDPVAGQLIFSSLDQLDPKVAATDWNNVAPRVGLAWRPLGMNGTVVRAGVGAYYSAMPWILELFPLALGTPSNVGLGFTNPQTIPIPTYQLGQNVFPPAPANVVTPAYAANLPPGTQVSALDPSFRTAYTNQWSFSVEQRIGQSDSVEVSYLGSSGHRLPVLTDLSQCRPRADLFCAAATRPWPKYGLVYWAASTGNVSSEMLVARYTRRTNRGLNLHVDYAFGKSLSDAWESSLLPRGQIATCRACDKGPATFDVRQRMVASVVWEVPFGRRHVAGGWTISGIATFASGQPVLLTGPNQTGSLFVNHLPNRGCDGRNSGLSGNIRNNGFLWFDPSCYQVPAAGYFGNSGATVLYGPGINNWDLGMTKLTPLTESVDLQIRAEFFNAWNHAQFQQPNGNAGAGANFGRISASRKPRLIQFGAKLIW